MLLRHELLCLGPRYAQDDYAFWLGQDAVWLVECDAVLRIPGDSVGADQEIEMARGLGKIIYLSLAEVPFIVRGVEFNRKES